VADYPQPPYKNDSACCATDVTELSANAFADFGRSALRSGMVYFCTWGEHCEKFHDMVDDVIAKDAVELRRAGPPAKDTVMTTWHDDEILRPSVGRAKVMQ